jgi:xanthine dehydrogenase accessory factor
MDQLKLIKLMNELASQGKPFAVATVVKTEGSTLGKPGFKVIIDSDGNVVEGTLGGACPESAIVDAALEAIKTKKPRTLKVFLEDVGSAVTQAIKSANLNEVHVETNCGGRMEIFIEPYTPPDRLVIISDGGHNEVATSLTKLAKMVGFEVHVIDATGMVEGADEIYKTEDISKFEFKESDYVVLVTMGRIDIDALTVLSKKRLAFLGLMASKKRIDDEFEKLRQKGVDGSFLSSIHAPVGADIGAQTPNEIALSILAEVVAVKHGKHLPHKG